jgi:hypothetical protein
MKKILLCALAALVLPMSAAAKEVQSVTMCGTGGACKAIAGGVQAFRDTFEGQGTANEPRTIVGAVPLRPFYKVGIKIRGDRTPPGQFSVVMWFVPPNIIRMAGGVRDLLSEPFREVPATLAAQLRATTAELKPFPPPRVMTAYVNDKRLDNARAYVHLFDELPTTDTTTESGSEFVNITLVPDRANPWFVDGNQLLYLNDAQSIFLVAPLKVSDELADRIASDAGLASSVHDSGTGWGRPVGIGILSGCLLAAIGVFIASTRRRQQARPSTA